MQWHIFYYCTFFPLHQTQVQEITMKENSLMLKTFMIYVELNLTCNLLCRMCLSTLSTNIDKRCSIWQPHKIVNFHLQIMKFYIINQFKVLKNMHIIGTVVIEVFHRSCQVCFKMPTYRSHIKPYIITHKADLLELKAKLITQTHVR